MKKIYLKPEIIVCPIVMGYHLLDASTKPQAEFCNFGTRKTQSWFNEGHSIMEKEPGLSIGTDNGTIDSRSKRGSVWDE